MSSPLRTLLLQEGFPCFSALRGSPTFFKRDILLAPGLVQQFPTIGTPFSPIVGPDGATIWFNNGNSDAADHRRPRRERLVRHDGDDGRRRRHRLGKRLRQPRLHPDAGPRLAFVDLAGNVTDDTKAAALSEPLAFDDAGNLWFGTDITIGYVTPAGKVVQFDIGGNGAFAILFNADGTVWFAAQFSMQIGLLNPANGSVTWFNLSGYPAGLTRGADGNPWFTEFTPKIGTIANSQVAEYTTQGAQPYPPILGSDGNVWFGDGGDGSYLTNRYIGNVTPSGTVSEWQTNGLPNGLLEVGGWIYFGENAPMLGRAFAGTIVR